MARGEYVTLFHQDDLMAPENLARKAAFLDEHPSAGFVHSNVLQIGPSGELISRWWYFEPTPADQARTTPSYTQGRVPRPGAEPSSDPTASDCTRTDHYPR